MYRRKSVGPRMEPWGISALTGYSCEDFPSRTTQSCLLLRKEEISTNIWPEIPYICEEDQHVKALKLLTKPCIYSSSSPRPVDSPRKSVRYNCQKICS